MNEEQLNWLAQLLLGVVQGATEIFPVSSSAHIAMTGQIWASFSGKSPASLQIAVILHLGTFFAIFYYFRKDVGKIIRATLASLPLTTKFPDVDPVSINPYQKSTPFFMLLSLAVTSVIAIVLEPQAVRGFETENMTSVLLFMNGLFLVAVGSFSSGTRYISDLRWYHFVVIGFAQGIAVMPGLSRLGLTISACLLVGLNWQHALRLAFVLSLPVVIAAAGYELLFQEPRLTVDPLQVMITLLLTVTVGWLAIRTLTAHARYPRRRLAYFGIYCLFAAPFFALYVFYFK